MLRKLIIVCIYFVSTSQALACYHFKIWNYPYPQRCNYSWHQDSNSETTTSIKNPPLLKPEVNHPKFPTFDRLGLYYRDWRIWRAEQIEVPDIVKK